MAERRPNRVTLTKREASQHQLEGAIENLFLGNWPAAITLAGAAEDILPVISDRPDLFSTAKTVGESNYGKGPQEVAELFNELRNWLKHDQTTNPNCKANQSFCQEDAVIMILRAHTRLHAHHSPLDENEVLSEIIGRFESWFRSNYGNWLKPIGQKK